MKINSVLISALVFASLNFGCGKNKGRASGQTAESHTLMGGEPRVRLLENQLSQSPAIGIPGYRILSVARLDQLPAQLRQLDNGTAIGNIDFEFEVRQFEPTYPGDIKEATTSLDTIMTAFRAFIFRHPANPQLMLIAALEAQPVDGFLHEREGIEIQHQLVKKCSKAYIPRRDRDYLPDQNIPCNYKTEVCDVRTVRQFVGIVVEAIEKMSIGQIEHNFPGSRCLERIPDFTQVSRRENSREARKFRIQLLRSLSSSEATAIESNL